MKWLPYEGPGHPAKRYFFALLAALGGLYLRILLNPIYGDHYPYLTAFPAVMFAAWFCGVGPAILATLLAMGGTWYLLLPPHNSFALEQPKAQFAGVVGFLFFSSLIIAMGEGNRRNRIRLNQTLHDVLEARAELETRVQERTVEVNSATESVRELSGRLLQVRDDEQRRLARELHDGAGQVIAAVAMDLGAVERDAEKLGPRGTGALKEARELVEQLGQDIRSISHLLHPPLLEEVGLSSALRWYVEGFMERSQIKVDLELGPLERVGSETEIAVFRIIQECLTNVHRHSGSSWALVRISSANENLSIEERDSGRGIPAERQPELSVPGRPGIGLPGMRERIRQLHGTLTVESDSQGTAVIAILPKGNSVDSLSNGRHHIAQA